MNPEMMLSQLAPLREPTPIGWWPLALGWWGIAIVLMIAFVVLWVWVRKRRNRRFYRRLALAELASLRAQRASAASVNRLLKAAALRAFPSEKVAALHLAKVGAHLSILRADQADYIGVEQQGPFKSEQYRY